MRKLYEGFFEKNNFEFCNFNIEYRRIAFTGL